MHVLILHHTAAAAILSPIHTIASSLPRANGSISTLIDALTTQCTVTTVLEPLRLQSHKPVPLPLLTPFMEEGHYAMKSDPDKPKRDSSMCRICAVGICIHVYLICAFAMHLLKCYYRAIEARIQERVQGSPERN
jgi:hypothetical protein